MRHFIDGASVVPTYTQQPLALTAELTVSLNEGETTAITKKCLSLPVVMCQKRNKSHE